MKLLKSNNGHGIGSLEDNENIKCRNLLKLWHNNSLFFGGGGIFRESLSTYDLKN